MPIQQKNPNLETRVGTLEIIVSSLANTVDKYIDSSQKHDAIMVSKLESVSNQIASQGKPNWAIWGTFFAIGVSILGYYVSAQVNPLQSQVTSNTNAINALDRENRRDNDEERKIILELSKDNAAIKKEWELFERGLLIQK